MTNLNLRTMKYSPLWRTGRPVFKNPEKPASESESAETPEQIEKVGKLLKDYERRRNDLLGVLKDFKKKEDPELRLKALQYENRVLNETVDPTVLRSLRGLKENDVKKYIEKIVDIANSTIERDERLAAWLEGREKEKAEREHLKIEQLVERYNYMRDVNISLVNEYGPFFSTPKTYADMMRMLTEEFTELSPDKETSKSMEAALSEFTRALNKFKGEIDKAVEARRAVNHERYSVAFYHAVGRAHERFLPLLETNPAEFERQVAAMVSNITEVDLSKAEAGYSWSVTYGGLTFAINRGGRGMYAKLTGASDENLTRYAKLGEYLEGRKSRTKTANRSARKIETEL